MRKWLLLIWTLLVMLAFPGCQDNSSVATAAPPAQTTTPVQTTAPVSEEDAFAAVLDGTEPFLVPGTGETLFLSQISRLFTTEEQPWTVEALSVLDLDGDGRKEAVLEISNFVGFVILRHTESGSVTATPLWYRSFQELKEDGSYLSSGSASSRSYFQSRAGGDVLLAECCENDGAMHYRVDGQEVDEAAFADFEAQQARKSPARWYATWQEYRAENTDA